MTVKLAAAPLGAWLLATVDASPYFVIGAFVLTLVFGWRAFRVRDFTSEIESLKAALNTADTVKKVDDERRTQLEEQLRGAQERANVHERLVEKLDRELEEWRKRYDERAAGVSLKEVREVMVQMAQAADKRHAETIDLIRRLAGEKSVTDPR